MTALFALDFTLMTVALFLIAWGVLRLNHPAPVTAMPAPPPTISRRDVTYINDKRPGLRKALREAIEEGYTYADYTRSDKGGNWITMRRDEWRPAARR